jgi:FtsP/CotA-like multicopper oxidase with cupredoxin domain
VTQHKSETVWRSGKFEPSRPQTNCRRLVASVHVEIPFSEIGDFVYHCHILEHEDGGMMAHIRVVAHH